MANKIIISLILIIILGVGGYNLLKSPEGCKTDTAQTDCNEKQIASYEIYPSDVVKKIKKKEKIILLDVRTKEEYSQNRITGAKLLPVQKLSEKTLIDISLNNKDEEIIIYCRSGSRSKRAYDLMKSLGYTNIKSIAGGLVHWQEDNYPFLETNQIKVTETNNNKKNILTNKPKISFNKVVYNFGQINRSAGIVKTNFLVSNQGVGILKIGELSTSCGCTTAKISKTEIKKGESAILTVSFNPNFHKEPLGEIIRTVFIPSNDPNLKEAEVKIKVEILEDNDL